MFKKCGAWVCHILTKIKRVSKMVLDIFKGQLIDNNYKSTERVIHIEFRTLNVKNPNMHMFAVLTVHSIH